MRRKRSGQRDADNPPIPSEAFDRAVPIADMADRAGLQTALAEAKRRGRGPEKTTKQYRLTTAERARLARLPRGLQPPDSEIDFSDAPELSAAQLRAMKPFPGDLPAPVADAIRKAQATGVIRRRRSTAPKRS